VLGAAIERAKTVKAVRRTPVAVIEAAMHPGTRRLGQRSPRIAAASTPRLAAERTPVAAEMRTTAEQSILIQTWLKGPNLTRAASRRRGFFVGPFYRSSQTCRLLVN
jgi:hypothetical protein